MTGDSWEEFNQDPAFRASRCKFVPPSEFASLGLSALSSLVPYEAGYGDCFFRPPESMKNHFFWNFVSAHKDSEVDELDVYGLLQDKFNEAGNPLYIFEPYMSISYVVSCEKLQLGLLHRFLRHANYSQHVMVVEPVRNLVFYLNTDMDFCVYSRDATVNDLPFEGVTDEDLVKMFKNDSNYNSRRFSAEQMVHIRNEVIPNCFEKGLV